MREPLTSDWRNSAHAGERASAHRQRAARERATTKTTSSRRCGRCERAAENVKLLSETLKERPWNLIRTDAAPGQKGPAMTNRRKRALRPVVGLIGALVLSACGSARYPVYYTLHFEPSI